MGQIWLNICVGWCPLNKLSDTFALRCFECQPALSASHPISSLISPFTGSQLEVETFIYKLKSTCINGNGTTPLPSFVIAQIWTFSPSPLFDCGEYQKHDTEQRDHFRAIRDNNKFISTPKILNDVVRFSGMEYVTILKGMALWCLFYTDKTCQQNKRVLVLVALTR